MDEHALLASADQRIRENRTAAFSLALQDGAGNPIAGAAVTVELTDHAFKFGSNGFNVRSIEDADLQRAYEARFAALLNYATLPFYWGGYEPHPDETREEHLHTMASWCKAQAVATKGHPLVWHEVFPRWAGEMADEEVLTRLEDRARALPAQFRGEVDIWDVVNEATVSHRFDNTVGRWIRRTSDVEVVAQALQWARAGNPEATLLYNDFNISEAFEDLVAALLDRGAPVDVIGIQSHMHQGTWDLARAWRVCETYAQFGLPLHFTELTVLSGRLKPKDETDWHKRHTDWLTTPEGEVAQADYGAQLYTLLFSHPAVEAITWWDFADYRAWQGAPAGMLRRDMSPKPLYDRLMGLIHGAWKTDVATTVGESGALACRCFFGEHRVTATLPTGEVLTGTFTAEAGGARDLIVTLAAQDA
jgi:GH35 family endo-1,4-beta-xylanase